mmetsp:Transcript_6229/g.8697  ORF Transcript_6229/g.8697 Transcript_6229/m.8697 type:complete len:209 (-) Transcript_6229:1766-2392(-)
MKTMPSKIKPPRLHGCKVGCLSTRSPHRPNNIGLSVCEVVTVGKDYIDISCVDMVDGTPVLDVKPYIPYDVIPSDYLVPSFPDVPRRRLVVPDWVVEADATALCERGVSFSEEALQSLNDLATKSKENRKSVILRHSESVHHLQQLVAQVLRQDIRGVAQGRGGGTEDERDRSGVYTCRLDGVEFEFKTYSDARVEVLCARPIASIKE